MVARRMKHDILSIKVKDNPRARPGVAQGQLRVSRKKTHLGCLGPWFWGPLCENKENEMPLRWPSTLPEGQGHSESGNICRPASLLSPETCHHSMEFKWVWINNLEKTVLHLWSLVHKVKHTTLSWRFAPRLALKRQNDFESVLMITESFRTS